MDLAHYTPERRGYVIQSYLESLARQRQRPGEHNSASQIQPQTPEEIRYGAAPLFTHQMQEPMDEVQYGGGLPGVPPPFAMGESSSSRSSFSGATSNAGGPPSPVLIMPTPKTRLRQQQPASPTASTSGGSGKTLVDLLEENLAQVEKRKAVPKAPAKPPKPKTPKAPKSEKTAKSPTTPATCPACNVAFRSSGAYHKHHASKQHQANMIAYLEGMPSQIPNDVIDPALQNYQPQADFREYGMPVENRQRSTSFTNGPDDYARRESIVKAEIASSSKPSVRMDDVIERRNSRRSNNSS